jgi:ATP-binding cassette subfamily B protein
MKLLWEYAKKYKKLLWGALALAFINQLFSLLDPQLFRIIIDKYATNPGDWSQMEFLQGVGLLLLGIVVVAFISRTAKAFQDYYVNNVTQTIGTKMYADGISHVFGLSYEVFEDERSGAVLLNLQKARDDSRKFIASTINVVFLSAVGMVFVVAYSFYVHYLIALTFLLLVPIVATVTYLISIRIKKAQEEIVRESADLSGSTTETLRNVGLIKSLGLEKQEVDRLNNINEKLLALEIKKIVLVRKLVFIQGTLVNLVRVLVLLVTLYLLWRGSITLGEFMIFTFYTFYIFNPLYNLSDVISEYQEAKASMGELSRILAFPKNIYDEGSTAVSEINSIEFKDVHYKYKGSEEESVAGVSFELNPGGTLGLVGPSGSGKSTLVKILTGLYKPLDGEVKVNGVLAEDIDFKSFRSRIGLVRQETELFAGTIRENLLFARPNASDDELTSVLKSASVGSLLERGSEKIGFGLDAKIGEAGIKLSGGERQRLAIARALLREPDLLIFDEATSSLDSMTEKEISLTIERVRKENPELMMLIIAHRLSTVTGADKILVLSKGKAVESGPHKELLSNGALYAALWTEQTS